MGPEVARAAALMGMLVSLAAAPASADWLQPGHDAARTFSTDEAGPEWDDVAWVVRLPGHIDTSPLILGGSAYVLTRPEFSCADESLPECTERVDGVSGIFRIDLDTAEVSAVVTFDLESESGIPGFPYEVFRRTLASDGERLFTTSDLGLDTFSLDGRLLWHSDLHEYNALSFEPSCTVPAAVSETLVVVACQAASETIFPTITYAAAFDPVTGEHRWTWTKTAGEEAGRGLVPPTCDASLPGSLCRSTEAISVPRAVSIVEPFVYVTTESLGGARGGIEYDAWTLNATTGDTLWAANSSALAGGGADFDATRCRIRTDASARPGCSPLRSIGPPSPTGDANLVYLKLDRFLRAHDPVGGTVLWTEDLGRADRNVGSDASAALDDGVLFVASSQTLARFNDPVPQAGWPFTLPAATTEAWGEYALVVTRDHLYAKSFSPDGTHAIYSIGLTDARVLWKHVFPNERGGGSAGTRFAVDRGVAVVTRYDGNVTALGRTAASPQPVADASTLFPGAGEAVEVDLSGSAPGAFGPATGFAADWGGGTSAGWQASPVLSHTYNSTGDKIARFMVRNDANQTASTTQVFHVGGTEPTFLEGAFSAERQEATFFVLGLVGTAIGGAIGVVRYRRRRTTLEREMKSIEEVYASTRTRPIECERALAERKAHVRGLLIDGRLDEGQSAALERRIDDLTRTLRLHELSDLLDLLPRGMAHALEEVLADGRVTTWERRSFLEVLEHDRVMPAEMKVRVRALIDEWYARDNTVAARTLTPTDARGEAPRQEG
ncbi:MAG TPA: PQQ-binding-like beta-propeller repeat protein [Candidatus Thermoplasmatota archaeon]|nr:PQQ-binding-like beta-propeller repeat protein [Candidatus Thermoplasmatota archaeon]